MTNLWRLIDDEEGSGAYNMAVDESILHCSPQLKLPTLRFYTWDPPALSLGYFQNIKEIDREACQAKGIDIVRRVTGGRAVLHRHELTYSLVMPLFMLPGTLIETYECISSALARGLKSLGLPAVLSPPRGRVSTETAACFDAPGSAEITVHGKKAIGSAQTRRGESLLQHGSIPLYNDYRLLTELLHIPEEKKDRLASLLDRKATSLGQIGFKIGKREEYQNFLSPLKQSIARGFEEEFGCTLETQPLTQEEQDMVHQYSKDKYSREEWTLERGHYIEKKV